MEDDDGVTKKQQKKGIKPYNYSPVEEHLKSILFGEGDCSFALSAIKWKGPAPDVTATTFESFDEVLRIYPGSKANLEKLNKIKVKTEHGVDVTKPLGITKYESIVFNNPWLETKDSYFGEAVKTKQHLFLASFFKNASGILEPKGKIHVLYPNVRPYTDWELTKAAQDSGFKEENKLKFIQKEFEGYTPVLQSGTCLMNLDKLKLKFHVFVKDVESEQTTQAAGGPTDDSYY